MLGCVPHFTDLVVVRFTHSAVLWLTGPTLPEGRHPLVGKQGGFVCGRPSKTCGDHFDQRVADVGLHCIQSSTALIDQGPDDG